MKSLIANIEDGNGLTENANRASLLIRFLIRRGLKPAPFELHHGRKPSSNLNIMNDRKAYIFYWSLLSISAPNKPNKPTYFGRDRTERF